MNEIERCELQEKMAANFQAYFSYVAKTIGITDYTLEDLPVSEKPVAALTPDEQLMLDHANGQSMAVILARHRIMVIRAAAAKIRSIPGGDSFADLIDPHSGA